MQKKIEKIISSKFRFLFLELCFCRPCPRTTVSSRSLALHWHLLDWVLQLHGSSQLDIVFSYSFASNFLVFINVKHLDLVFDIRNFLIFCIALLCLFIWSLWMCGSIQHNKMCLHMSGSVMWHNE